MTMSPDQVLSFLAFSVASARTPGPSNAMIVASAVSGGFIGGLRCVLGVSSGLCILLFTMCLGLGEVVIAHPSFAQSTALVGAALMLWIAWRIAVAPVTEEGEGSRAVGFVAAIAFQFLNPKAWMIAISASAAYSTGLTGGAWLSAGRLAGLFFCAAIVCGLCWVFVGMTAARLLESTQARRTFNLGMGALLALSVILALI